MPRCSPSSGSLLAAGALPAVRTALNDYVRALHTPHGTLGMTPFEAYGALAPVRGPDAAAPVDGSAAAPPPIPRLRYTRRVDDVTRETLDATVRELRELAAAAGGVGDPSQHPWRDATKTLYTEDDIAAARELASALAGQLAEVRRQAAEVAAAFGIPEIRNTADVDTADRIATVMSRSPGAPATVLASAGWNAPPAEALRIIERGREMIRLRARAESLFTPAVFDREHAADIAFVERKAEGLFGFLALLDGRWRAIRARWRTYRLPTYQPSLLEQAAELKQVDRYLAERTAIAEVGSTGARAVRRALAGRPIDLGCAGRLRSVGRRVPYVASPRYGLGADAIAVAAQRAPNVDRVHALRDATADTLGTLAELRRIVGWPDDYLVRRIVRGHAAARRVDRDPCRPGAALGCVRGRASNAPPRASPAESLGDAMRGAAAVCGATRRVPSRVLHEVDRRGGAGAAAARAIRRAHARAARSRSSVGSTEQVLVENQTALVGQLRERAQERAAAASSPRGAPIPPARDGEAAQSQPAAQNAAPGRAGDPRHQAVFPHEPADGRAVSRRPATRRSTS